MEIYSFEYQFKVKEIKIREFIKARMVTKKVICIGLLDNKTDIFYPHPLTNFIRIKYELFGKSLNSQTLPANVICRFLNYVNLQIKSEDSHFLPLKTNGIYGLDLIHGSKFISYLTSKGLRYSTVTHYERVLTNFYQYLVEVDIIHSDIIINKNPLSDSDVKSIFRGAKLQTKLPSKKYSNNKQSKLKDFGESRYELTQQFINIAREVAPEIAFGICLQFFGGLRRGEVVNLSIGDILVNKRDSMSVEIKDNREKLFSRLKDTKCEYPKRLNYLQTNLCVQTIIDTDLVWETYDEHIKTLEFKRRKHILKNPIALFVDKDGKPMSGKVYERRFKKVKTHFLNSLIKADRYDEYNLFNQSYWGTHIGRGIFTNFLLDMGLSVTQIAIARGDRNISSSMAYVDQKLSTELVRKAINEIKNIPNKELGNIDKDYIKHKWKDGIQKSEKRFSYY